MSENDMSIDPIHYGGLVQQVAHLAKAQEDHNRMQQEHRLAMEEQRDATSDLAQAVRALTDRLAKLEGSPFMQPAKLGKAAPAVKAVAHCKVWRRVNGVWLFMVLSPVLC